MATTPVTPPRTTRRVSARGLVIFAIAVAAVVVAAVVGIRGLMATPIESVAADGTATLHGTWEPYSCDAHACQGYVQAGGRSVFIVLPSGCPEPSRASEVTVRARADASLGTASYRVIGCAG
jgi:hypothetical protein